jgi:tetratricopeptide (TPR) repeat protein
MLKAEKDYDQAFHYYAKSNSLFLNPENNASVEQISGSFENLADAHCAQGNFTKGLEIYQKGMQYLAPNLASDYLINPKISNNPIISKTYLRRQLGLKANALFNFGQKNKDKKAYLSTIDAIHKYDSLTVMLLNEDWREESHLNLIQVANEDYKFALLSAQVLDKMNGGDKSSIEVYETLSKLKARLLSRGIIQKDIKAQNLNDSLMILDKQYLSEISYANTIKSRAT